MLVRDYLLPEFDQEMAATRPLIERLPESKLDWRPHPKNFTLQELSSHLINIPNWLTLTLDTNELDFAASNDWETPRATSAQHALEIWDAIIKNARNKLLSTTDEAFAEPWTLKNGQQILFTIPKRSVYRGFVMNHLIHHRGQYSVYLRLLEVPLPQVYGPTSDAPAMQV